MLLYLILSHRRPEQVLRLARRLLADDPAACVVIHHDAAAGPFGPTGDDRILLVPGPVAVQWGDISVVSALLMSLRWIQQAGLPYRWLVLLSGQDYPARSQASLLAELDASGVDGFIEHAPAAERFAEDNETRYAFRYMRLPGFLEPLVKRAWRINGRQPLVRLVAMRSGCYFGVRAARPFDAHLRCYRGSFWWTLARPCIDYLVAYAHARPDVLRAFARRLIPDEAFVPSVLASAGFKLVNDDQRFIVWPGNDDGSPRVLRDTDADALAASGKRFARKFDAGVDANVLARLDAAAGLMPAGR